MSKYSLPEIPDNQRWHVSSLLGFMHVKLQEKRWWGGSNTEDGFREALEHCVNQKHYERIEREYAQRVMHRKPAGFPTGRLEASDG